MTVRTYPWSYVTKIQSHDDDRKAEVLFVRIKELFCVKRSTVGIHMNADCLKRCQPNIKKYVVTQRLAKSVVFS